MTIACHRCRGFMVQEWMIDPDDQIPWVLGYRCVNCGEIAELVLLHHRQMKALPKKFGRKTRHPSRIPLQKAS